MLLLVILGWHNASSDWKLINDGLIILFIDRWNTLISPTQVLREPALVLHDASMILA